MRYGILNVNIVLNRGVRSAFQMRRTSRTSGRQVNECMLHKTTMRTRRDRAFKGLAK
jgi:hypothetical protein